MSARMAGMAELTDRTKANMEVVLGETCRSLPHGGGHELRAFIAQRMANTAASGRTTIGHLSIIARKARADYQGQ
jgi:hypothetical protein